MNTVTRFDYHIFSIFIVNCVAAGSAIDSGVAVWISNIFSIIVLMAPMVMAFPLESIRFNDFPFAFLIVIDSEPT